MFVSRRNGNMKNRRLYGQEKVPKTRLVVAKKVAVVENEGEENFHSRRMALLYDFSDWEKELE